MTMLTMAKGIFEQYIKSLEFTHKVQPEIRTQKAKRDMSIADRFPGQPDGLSIKFNQFKTPHPSVLLGKDSRRRRRRLERSIQDNKSTFPI